MSNTRTYFRLRTHGVVNDFWTPRWAKVLIRWFHSALCVYNTVSEEGESSTNLHVLPGRPRAEPGHSSTAYPSFVTWTSVTSRRCGAATDSRPLRNNVVLYTHWTRQHPLHAATHRRYRGDIIWEDVGRTNWCVFTFITSMQIFPLKIAICITVMLVIVNVLRRSAACMRRETGFHSKIFTSYMFIFLCYILEGAARSFWWFSRIIRDVKWGVCGEMYSTLLVISMIK